MQIGRRLNKPPIVLNMDDVRRWFKENGTVCESPLHKLGEEPPAVTYYQTDWSFAFLCAACNAMAKASTGSSKTAWDRRLAEHMYQLMVRRSYVHANIQSDFMLEEIIAQRNEAVKQIEQEDKKRDAAERGEIRKHIRESPVKVGMADDEILSARQRQVHREQSGAARVGPARVDRASVLRAKLIAPLPRKEGG